MDFMFEDEVDEVGSDVEAYCPKCKGDTTHVVISKYEDEIRRVQCNPCGDVHSFRKPRGDVEDDVPEPIAAKKRALMKKPTFDEFFAKHSDKNAKPYEFREHYHENVIVTHPKFGKGFVSEIMSDSKVEITFKDSRRVLVHNRKDMPGLPLAAEGDGHPSDAKLSGKVAKAPVKGEKADKPEKAEKPEKAAPPPKAEKPEKSKKPEKPEKAAATAKADKPAEKGAAAAKAAKPPVTRAQPPAAKVAKRTAKPARPVHVASAKRAHPPTAKRAAKVAKRGKK
jgi:hypothetical protein